MGAPTLDEARRAAEAVLRTTPDAEVLLYGSLARGEATENSDLDLYVLYADIDYAKRQEIASRLAEAVREVLKGRSFDLHVSDLPEWDGRSAISNTFEHEIGEDVVLLAGNIERDAVYWGKLQARPMTTFEEARQYLESKLRPEMSNAITNAMPQRREEPRRGSAPWGADADEQNEELHRQTRAETNRLDRMVKLVASCAMVVELSVKAAGILQGRHPRSVKGLGHVVEDGLAALDEPLRQQLRGLVTAHGLTAGDLSGWRMDATYPDDIEALRAAADADAYAYLDTAIDVASRVIAEHEAQAAGSRDVRESLEELIEARRDGNVRWAGVIDEEAA